MEKKVTFVPMTKDGKEPEPQQTIEVVNPELEEILQICKKDRTVENLNKLLVVAHNCRVLCPMIPGPNNMPIPIVLKTQNEMNFLPLYTNKTQIKDMDKTPIILNVPFEDAVRMGASDDIKVNGIVMNPFGENIIIDKKVLKQVAEVDEKRKKAAKATPVNVTPDQYCALMRKQFEFTTLPKKFFEGGAEFMDQLMGKKEEFIDALYEETYTENRLYPYLPEEFSVMAMDISEDLRVVSLDMPARYFIVPCALRIYMTFNPVTGKGHYFTIEMSQEKDVHKLGEFKEDIKHIDLGVAPVEGAELQAIIDLAKGV